MAGDTPVMLDGGIRRGSDVLKALALGARFVFLGRSLLYAAIVGEAAGVRHAVAILSETVDRNLALLGRTTIGEIDSICITAVSSSQAQAEICRLAYLPWQEVEGTTVSKNRRV